MNSTRSVFLKSLLFSVTIAVLHLLVATLLEMQRPDLIGYSHLFFFVVSLVILLAFSKAVAVMIEKAGFVFIGMEFLKAGALVVFLMVLEKNGHLSNPLLANIMAVYLMHLFFSMFMGVRMLNEVNKNNSSK